MGTLLRYPYEVRADSEYFDDIEDVKITKEMLELARRLVRPTRFPVLRSLEPEITNAGALQSGCYAIPSRF
jgi:hypothetical protein